MGYKELEQLISLHGEQAENISLAEAYIRFIGNEDEKKEVSARTDTSK